MQRNYYISVKIPMKLVPALLLLALASCATITASGDQDIAIATTPAGASCVLSNTQQTVTLESTPGTANVQRMFEPLNVECTKPGYMRGEAIIEAKTRGRAWGNILLLGVPAVVDTSTGKGYEYDPDSVSITLLPASLPAQ
jgi:hypothetical protein